jgi:hypothetical protein
MLRRNLKKGTDCTSNAKKKSEKSRGLHKNAKKKSEKRHGLHKKCYEEI